LFQALVRLVVTDIMLNLDQFLAQHAQAIALNAVVSPVHKFAFHVMRCKNLFQALVKLVLADIMLSLIHLIAYRAQVITLHVLFKVVQ
jgi:hypothetical protein